MIPVSKPVITKEMVEAAVYALENEKLVMGESVFKFEEAFAKYIGVKYAVSLNSGTSALIVAFHIINIKNCKFVAPSATFISTVSSGMLVGGEPLFADINLNTYTIDVGHVSELLDKHEIKAVVPVHLYGYPCDMDSIMSLAEEKGVFVIEDCAQAHGAVYKGRKVGTFGYIGIFSFYSIKNMTVGGDGGMLVTNDEDVAEKARKLRDCGRRGKYSHDMLGYVFRLNTVNAAIGLVQLKYLDEWNERRRQIACLYDKLLSDLEDVVTPPKPKSGVVPVYHLYVVRLPSFEVRNALGAWLLSQGIQTLVHYPIPVHLQPVLGKYGFREGMLPRTELWARTVLTLPMFPELKDDEVKYVCEKIHEFFDKEIYKNKEWIRRGLDWYQKLI